MLSSWQARKQMMKDFVAKNVFKFSIDKKTYKVFRLVTSMIQFFQILLCPRKTKSFYKQPGSFSAFVMIIGTPSSLR